MREREREREKMIVLADGHTCTAFSWSAGGWLGFLDFY
jgi:hypothetical protein